MTEISMMHRFTPLNVALIAVFAAIQTVSGIMPFTIAIGVSGFISIGVMVAPLSGIVIGPIFGGLSTLTGSIIGGLINPASWVLGPFTIIPPTVAAICCGLVKFGKGYLCGIFIWPSILAFYLNPIGQLAFIYPWLHIIAGIVALTPISTLAYRAFRGNFKEEKRVFVSVGAGIFGLSGGFISYFIASELLGIIPWGLISGILGGVIIGALGGLIFKFMGPITFGTVISVFIGTLADNILGGALGTYYFPAVFGGTDAFWASIYNLVVFVYPVERAVVVLVVATIGAAVYLAAENLGVSSILAKQANPKTIE